MGAILFDYNGVLVDDEDVHFVAFQETIAKYGITLDRETYIARYLGFDDRGAFRAMLEDAGRAADDRLVDELIESKKPRYLASIDHVHAFRGATEIVARCAKRGLVGIVSGALRSEIELGMKKLGIEKHVAFVVAAEDTTACKPDPMGYALGAQKLHALGFHGRACAIEDSLAGVEAAKRAGLRCVAVTHTYSREELARVGADAIADSLGEITDEMLE